MIRISCLTFLVFLFAICAAACSAPAQPTAVPTVPPIIISVVATPEATITPRAITTAVATPTAFVTAPAAGKAAIVPILMYHHLRDLPSDASELLLTWTVAPANFDAQMNLVAARGFQAITMAQLVGHLKAGKPLPAKPIVISFDDGWAEQYSVAFQILKKHNLIGTFFVYTRPLDHAQYMSWAQLQEMSSAGMDIQAHTLTHPHLRELTPDEAMKEITDSKTVLETRLGKPIVAFAYPFGEYNNSIIDMLKRAGYESAVTLASGFNQRADELFTLHRIRVSYPDTLDDFAKHLPN